MLLSELQEITETTLMIGEGCGATLRKVSIKRCRGERVQSIFFLGNQQKGKRSKKTKEDEAPRGHCFLVFFI